jgi:hypothetical protein
MGIRREKPPVERSADSIVVRLPDGSVRTMPVDRTRSPATPDVCCFCGEGVERADGNWIRVDVRWGQGDGEGTQSWGAHRRCLVERMHERVAGTGPFFAD